MDIRRILRQRDKIADVMLILNDIFDEADDAEDPITDFERKNLVILDVAINHCEKAHIMLTGLYERLCRDYEEVYECESIRKLL